MNGPHEDELRETLARVAPSLRPIAKDVLAQSTHIDLLAVADDGAAVAVFDAGQDDLAAFTRAVGSLSWLEAQIPLWVQIAPHQSIEEGISPYALLLAPTFQPETRAAAERLAGTALVLLETSDPEASRAALLPLATSPQTASDPPNPFRTQLTDEDLEPLLPSAPRGNE